MTADMEGSRPQVGSPFVTYVITLALDTISGFIRFAFFYVLTFFLAAIPLLIVFFFLGGVLAGNVSSIDEVFSLIDNLSNTYFAALLSLCFLVGFAFAWLPYVASLLSYVGISGGDRLTRFVLGARDPSHRELNRLLGALERVNDMCKTDEASAIRIDEGLIGFSSILVIDTTLDITYVVGRALYVSSGLLDEQRGRHLDALIAHEVGHNQYNHGGLILSLRRLVFPLFQLFVGSIRKFSTSRPASRTIKELGPTDTFYTMINAVTFFLFSLIGGGLGVLLMSPWWASYFRKADYLADWFVVQLGLGHELIEYLEEKKFYDTSVPYMMAWVPANELRIDRIGYYLGLLDADAHTFPDEATSSPVSGPLLSPDRSRRERDLVSLGYGLVVTGFILAILSTLFGACLTMASLLMALVAGGIGVFVVTRYPSSARRARWLMIFAVGTLAITLMLVVVGAIIGLL